MPGLYLPEKGMQKRRGFIEDLDAYAFADPSLFPATDPAESNFWLPFQTRRGCPLGCNYCSTASVEGNLIRRRSPDAVAKALVRWAEAGFKRFFFVDNTFNLPPEYAKTLCSRISETGLDITWRCILYPGKVDLSLVKEMARAGCKEVSLGFESGSNRVLQTMNKRFTTEDIRRASRMLADHGIGQMGFLLLGSPNETKETVEESLSFVDSLPLNALKFTVGIRIYPDTDLARTAVNEGVISSEDTLLHPTFYLAKSIEPWLRETVEGLVSERHNWMY